MASVNHSIDHILAFDIGGTNIRAAIANPNGDPSTGSGQTLLAQASVPTVKYDGQPDYGDIFTRLRDSLCTQSGIDPNHLLAVGASVAGVIDPDTGLILMAPNISSQPHFDLRSILVDALGLDVAIENDVNLAAVGEHWLGVARGHANFIFVAIGTGVGAGIFIGGHLYRGAHNAAGRLGHMYVHGMESLGTDGLGALERRAAGPAIARVPHPNPSSPEDIWKAASQGDPTAQEALDDILDTLALGLANASMLLDPELIVLGGGVSKASDALLLPLRERISALVMHPVAPRLELSTLGPAAQLYGAARYATDHAQ